MIFFKHFMGKLRNTLIKTGIYINISFLFVLVLTIREITKDFTVTFNHYYK